MEEGISKPTRPIRTKEEIEKAKEELGRVYELKIGDGSKAITLKMFGLEIYRMVENSLIAKVEASGKIEGKEALDFKHLDELKCQDPFIMVEHLRSILESWK